MSGMMESVVAIATAIIGVAALAVLVSKNAQTGSVLQAGGQAFSGALNAATAPVTGGGTMPSWPAPAFGTNMNF